jgi:hypothetical protein
VKRTSSSVPRNEGVVTTTVPLAARSVVIEGLYGVETLNPDNAFPEVDVVTAGAVGRATPGRPVLALRRTNALHR